MRDHQQTRILESTPALGRVFIELYGEFGHRLSPFQCSLGYQPPLFPSQETEVAVPSVRALLRWCRHVWKAARHAMINTRDQVQRVANRWRVPAPAYCPGQKVWLLAKDLPLPTLSWKLAPHYVGPYTNERVINPSALRLQLLLLPQGTPCFSRVAGQASSRQRLVSACPHTAAAPDPRDLVWEVSRILAVRCRGRGFHYLVDWVGYGPEDRSSVPRSYFADPSLLEDFYRANPQAVGWSPGVSRREGVPVAGQQSATPPTQVSSMRPRAGNQSTSIRRNPVQLRRSSRRVQSPSRT